MANKTSHSLAFEMVVNTKKFTKGMNLSKKEINLAKREMTSLLTPAEKMEVKLHKLGELAKKDASFQASYNEALKRSQRQMDRAAKSAKGFGSQLKTMATAYISFQSVKALSRGFDEQINKLDALGKQATRTGASVEFLSRTQFIAGRTSGMTAEATANAIDKMTKNVGDAVQGSGAGFDALNKTLGFTKKEIRELAKLSPDLMFERLRDRISQVKDQSVALNLATDLFGRTGGEIVTTLQLQNDAYQEQITLAEKLGAIRTKAQTDQAQKTRDDLDAAKAELDGLKAELAIAAAPAASAFAGGLRGRAGFLGIGKVLTGKSANPMMELVNSIKQIDEGFLGRELGRLKGKDLQRTPAEIAAIQKALKEGRDEEEKKRIDANNLKQASFLARGITAGIHGLMQRGKGMATAAELRLGAMNVRQVMRPDIPEIATKSSTTTTGPMASVRAGSSEAFRLLNQTTAARTIEVQLAKTTAEKSVQTVDLLTQMRDLMGKNIWQQKEYNEKHGITDGSNAN